MPDQFEIGFDRPKTEPLAGSVKFYQRHLFICSGQVGWPAHIHRDGGFAQALDEALEAHAQELTQVVKLNVCDAPSLNRHGHDLLVFPDMVRYLGLETRDIAALVKDHLAGGGPSDRLPHEPLLGRHVFVCAHENRDPRCGFCGPRLAELFTAQATRLGLTESVHIHCTSHVGGHQFAGNVLIYPGGDWYGYVTPADVPLILDRHIQRGEMIPQRWRGRMGLTTEEQLALVAEYA